MGSDIEKSRDESETNGRGQGRLRMLILYRYGMSEMGIELENPCSLLSKWLCRSRYALVVYHIHCLWATKQIAFIYFFLCFFSNSHHVFLAGPSPKQGICCRVYSNLSYLPILARHIQLQQGSTIIHTTTWDKQWGQIIFFKSALCCNPDSGL